MTLLTNGGTGQFFFIFIQRRHIDRNKWQQVNYCLRQIPINKCVFFLQFYALFNPLYFSCSFTSLLALVFDFISPRQMNWMLWPIIKHFEIFYVAYKFVYLIFNMHVTWVALIIFEYGCFTKKNGIVYKFRFCQLIYTQSLLTWNISGREKYGVNP